MAMPLPPITVGWSTQVGVEAPSSSISNPQISYNPVNIFNSPDSAVTSENPMSSSPTITQPVSANQDQRGGVQPNMSMPSPNFEYTLPSTVPSGEVDSGIFGGNSMLIYAAIAGVVIILIMRKKA